MIDIGCRVVYAGTGVVPEVVRAKTCVETADSSDSNSLIRVTQAQLTSHIATPVSDSSNIQSQKLKLALTRVTRTFEYLPLFRSSFRVVISLLETFPKLYGHVRARHHCTGIRNYTKLYISTTVRDVEHSRLKARRRN